MIELLPFKTSQERLLHVVWNRIGGPAEVARILKIVTFMPTNWRVRGRVPLRLVGRVARKLALQPEIFNYEHVIQYQGSGPTWKKVVDGLGLPKEEYDYVMMGQHPKILKRLVDD